MKFLSLMFFASLLAIVYSAALPSEEEWDLATREIKNSNALAVTDKTADGLNSIAIYNNGVFEGTLVEQKDGGVVVYDPEGKVIDTDQKRDLGSDLESRQISRIIIVFARFIRRFGSRAWVSFLFSLLPIPLIDKWSPELTKSGEQRFLRCVGFTTAINCASQVSY